VANVANGGQALQTIEETLPDLVLMVSASKARIAASTPRAFRPATILRSSISLPIPMRPTLERARATKPTAIC
jgi:hypothetical protein